MNSTDQLEQMRLRYLQEAVQTATPAARLVMIVDTLEMALGRASAALADGSDDPYVVRDYKVVNDHLCHAQMILLGLHDTIDEQAWDEAKRLKALYFYLHDKLVEANIRKDRAIVIDVAEQVAKLAAAWRKAAEQCAQAQPASAAS